MTNIKTDFQQHVPLGGTPNLRDLGGRSNREGKIFKRNKVFRSGFLTNLTEEDWAVLASKNIRRVCDFRRKDEVERMPTQATYPIDLIHLPVGDGSHTRLITKAFESQNTDSKKTAAFMHKVNEEFVYRHSEAFAAMFQELLNLEQDESLLFHCTAGKDRTGYAAALILFALGFEKEDVFEDYLLTCDYFIPEVEMAKIAEAFPGDQIHSLNLEIIRPILEARTEFLETAIRTIEERQSIDDYLEKYMQLDQSAIQKLRRLLLED